MSVIDVRGFLRDEPVEPDLLDHRCWPPDCRGSSDEPHGSLLTFVEDELFAQVMSLDSCAIFLRQREDFVSPVAVDMEVASSRLKLYTCCDSFLTLCGLLDDLLRPHPTADPTSRYPSSRLTTEGSLLGDVSVDAFAPPTSPFRLRCDVLIIASGEHREAAHKLQTLLEAHRLNVQVNALESDCHASVIFWSNDKDDLLHKDDTLQRLASSGKALVLANSECPLPCSRVPMPEEWTDAELMRIGRVWFPGDLTEGDRCHHADDGVREKEAEVLEACLSRENRFVVCDRYGREWENSCCAWAVHFKRSIGDFLPRESVVHRGLRKPFACSVSISSTLPSW